jgi:gliding motility-associated-like protein
MNKLIPILFLSLAFILHSQTNQAQNCPELNGFLVNSCADPVPEGNLEGMNEMVVFHTGSYEYDLNNLTIEWSNGAYAPTSGFCLSGCATPSTDITATPAGNTGFTTNPQRVAELNLIAFCPNNLLFSPTSSIIPADATVIVFAGGSCWPEPIAGAYYPYDFSAFCGQGPIYVIFKNDCAGNGKFGDNATSGQVMGVTFGSASNGCNTNSPCSNYTVTYIGGNYNSPANNGAGTLVSGSGVTTGTYVNSNCNPPGFIPPTGQVCDQTPPDVNPISLCGTPSAANPITQTIDVTYVAGGATLEWYNAQVGGTLLGTTTTANPDFTYTFTNSNSIWVLSDDADCVNPSCRIEVPVTVFPIPTVNFTPATACVNTQVCLTGTSNEAGTTFSWYIESPTGIDVTGALNITDNPICFTPTEVGDYQVCVEVFGANCNNTYCDIFTVSPSPSVNIVGGGSLCSGSNLTLTASVAPVGTTTYTWAAANGGSISGATTNANITVTTAGTYNVTVTQNGCSATDSQPVATSSSPIASIVAPASICPGGTATLTASGAGVGGSYQWSAGAGGTITTANNIAAITVSGVATYTVTVTNSAGCTHTAQHNLSAATTPNAVISGATTICSGSSGSNVALSASGGGAGAQYAWSATNGGIIAGSSTNTNISASTEGTYIVTVTNSAGCTATNQHIITATAPPVPSINALSTTLCPGNSINLTASGGGSYQWSQVGIGPIIGQTNAVLTVTAGGSYAVIVTNANGCTASTIQNISAAAANPVASISGGSSLCAGSTLQLTASGAGAGGSYNWSASGGGIIAGANDQASITATSVGTYSVTVSNSSGCTDVASQNISAGLSPNAAISGPGVLCVGSSLTLTATGGTGYQWQLNGGNIAGETSTTLVVTNPGSYSVVVSNAQGCTAASTPHIVTSGSVPSASISGNTQICAGGNPVLLTASGGAMYQWQLNGTDIAGANSDTYSANAAGTYSVVVSNIGGCSASASHILSSQVPTTPTISGNAAFCAVSGGNTILSSSAASGNQWLASGINILGATNNTYSVTVPGSYSVVVSDAAGCTAQSAPILVSANNPPNANTAAPTTSLCNNNLAGNTLTLSLDDLVLGQSGGTWSTTAPPASITAGNVFNAEGLAEGTYSFTYTVSGSAPCPPQSSTQSVSVVFCPANCNEDAQFDPPSDICSSGGSTLSLNSLFTATTTLGGTWSSNAPVGTITGSDTFNATGLVGTYNITYTVTGAAGCPDEFFTLPITVITPPDASTTAPLSALCSEDANNTVDLSTFVSGDLNGTWTCPQAPAGTINGNLFDATGLAPGNYTIIYTVNGVAPCVGTDVSQQTLVVISPQDVALTQSTCEDTYIINAGTIGAGSWSVVGALSATIDNPNSPTTNVTLTGGEGNYTFIWSPASGNPCINTVTISLTYATTGAFAGNDATVCGATHNFGASGAGMWTYTGPGTALFSDISNGSSSVSVSDYGSYTFTWTVTSGACSGSDEVTIFFFPEPTADPSPASPTEQVCGLSYNLTPAVLNPDGSGSILGDWTDITGGGGIAIPAGITCAWEYSGPAGAIVTFSPDANTPEASVSVSQAGTYTFAWVCDGNSLIGCGEPNLITIQFIEPLTLDVSVNCLGTTQYTVDINIIGGLAPYTANAAPISGNSFSQTFADGIDYSIIIDDNSPCNSQSAGGLNPSCGCPPVPSPTINGNSNYCVNDPMPTFTTTPFAPNYEYNWYAVGNSTPIVSNSLTFTPPADGDYYVVAVVQDGCTSLPTNFSVYQIPTPPLPNLLPNYTYCQNETASPLATAQTIGGTIYWLGSDGNSGSGTSFVPNTTAEGTISYEVFEEGVGFCLGAIATTVITVNNCACPELNTISGISHACSGDMINLEVTLNDPAGNLDHIEWHDENGNLVSGDITRTISGCTPQIFAYTLEIYCNNNPSVPFQTEVVPITFYPVPTANVTLSNNGCTLTATPTCPDFAIVGSTTADSNTNGDNSIFTFEVVNTAAAIAGLNCINTASNAFDCTIVVNCPIIETITPNASACSGEAVSLTATIEDPTNQMHHVEWINELGIVIATSNSLNTLGITVSNTASSGCSPQVFNYTFNVYCDNDTTVVSSSQQVPVTFYPTPSADISLTADGCTAIATPDCPNFGIQGSPIQIGTGTNPYSFTIRSNDAFAMGIASGCAVTLTGNFNCNNAAPCPSIAPMSDMTVCSGQSFNIIPPIINSNQLSSANWTDALGNTLSNNADLNGIIITNNSCDIVTYTYTCSVYCSTDPTTPSYQEDVNIIVQPAFNPALLLFDEDPNCVNPPTVSAASCLNYIVTPVDVPAPQAGDNTSTWNVTYNGGIGCINTPYTYDYTCAGCFTVSNAADATASICDGDTPNWAAIMTNVNISDPTTFVNWEWYTDAALTTLAVPSDWQHQGSSCDPFITTFYAGGICTLSPTPIAGGQVTVTVYPDFDVSLLQSTAGDCNNLPTLISTCPNYILNLDPTTMPTLPISTSGVTVWEVSINGSSCFNETYQVPYVCGGCPIATINNPIATNGCSNEAISIDLNVLPATAVLGTDYTVQWQANGVDIVGATNATLNHNLPITDCNTLDVTYTAVYTCLLPVPEPPQNIAAGTITVNPTYNENNLLITNTDCNLPTVTSNCAYTISTPVPPPVAGQSGTAVWTVSSSNACFADTTVTLAYNCPQCPSVTTAANATRDICNGTVLSAADLDAIAATVIFSDNSNTANGFAWFADAALTTALAPADYTTANTCDAEVITAYLALLCTDGTQIAAGTLTLTVYPTPTTAASAGGCSLVVNPNCAGNLTIEYLVGGVWQSTAPINPTDGQSVDWRAYVTGAPDNDGDGNPDCVQSGTATAQSCNCVPPTNPPTAINTDISVCEGEVNTVAFEVSVEAGAFAVWLNALGDSLASGNTYVPTLPGTYTVQAYSLADTCAGQQISATLSETLGETVSISYPDTLCLGNAAVLPTVVGTASGAYSVNPLITIDAITGAFSPETLGTFTVTFTPDGACNTGSTAAIVVEDCAIITCTPPAAPIATVDELSVCIGEINTAAFEVQAVAADLAVVWHDAAGNEVANGTTFVPTIIGTYTAQVVMLNDTCVSATISATLSEIASQTLVVNVGADVNVCAGETVSLQGIVTGNSDLTTWTSMNGGTFANSSNPITTFTPNGVGIDTLILTASSSANCVVGSQDTLIVSVQPTIIIDVTGDNSIFVGESTELTATGATNYAWTPAASLSCADCAAPTASPLATTTYTISSSDVCAEPTTFTVTVTEVGEPSTQEIVMPTAFSPNGDEQNDVLKPLYSGTISNYYMAVYNRWGQKLFETSDLNTGWDGLFGGLEQEIGVYVYYVTYTFEGKNEDMLRGNVTLVR